MAKDQRKQGTHHVDVNDIFGSSSVACQFPTVGHSYKGTVLGFKVQQQINMETGEPETWADGSPKNQVLITLDAGAKGKYNTSLGQWEEVEDDDGVRTLYAKGGIFTAVRDALRLSRSKLAEGGTLEIIFVGLGTASKKGWNPPKRFKAVYTPPAEVAEDPFAV